MNFGTVIGINGIEVFLPFALAVAALLLVARVVVSRRIGIGAFARNVAVGGPFFHLGFVRVDGLGGGVTVVFGNGFFLDRSGSCRIIFFELLDLFGLDLRRCGADSLP